MSLPIQIVDVDHSERLTEQDVNAAKGRLSFWEKRKGDLTFW